MSEQQPTRLKPETSESENSDVSDEKPKDASHHGSAFYGLKRLARMYRKELRETLRDRRTMVTLLLMPLLLYPILSMALNRFLLSVNVPEAGYTVCLQTQGELDLLSRWLSDERSRPPKMILDSRGGELASFRLGLCQSEDAAVAIEANEADVGVKIEVTPVGENVVSIFSHRGDAVSETARQILVERLHWLSESDAAMWIRSRFPRYRAPLSVMIQEVGEAKESSLLATLIPLVLVLMTITGAVYPAIDLTAGERERGTLEAVMASPVPRFSVLLSKYFAVISVACLTAIANLAAMFTTLWGSGLIDMIQQGAGPPWMLIAPMLLLLVLFSFFFSAVLLALTSYARSFKEAQAYLIPVMLMSLAPAMISLVPGIELRGVLVVVPLVNIVLLARDLLAGELVMQAAAVSVSVTILYACGALAVAARLFGGDAVMRSSEQSIISLIRRPDKGNVVPRLEQATLLLALLVPSYFVVSNGLMLILRSYGELLDVSYQLLLNATALVVTFGVLPLISVWWERCRIAKSFRVSPASLGALLGSLLLGLGCWAFAHEAFVIADTLGIGGLSENQVQTAEAMVEKMREAPLWLLLAVFAVTPAVVEELCFRGYFFSSLGAVVKPWSAVIVTAIAFGLFHVLTGNALLVERFVPSTLMGIVIGWVAYRTGSVLPGMLIHFVHNALLNVVIYYADRLSFLGDGFDDQTHLPLGWLLTAGICVFIGGACVHWSTRSAPKTD